MSSPPGFARRAGSKPGRGGLGDHPHLLAERRSTERSGAALPVASTSRARVDLSEGRQVGIVERSRRAVATRRRIASRCERVGQGRRGSGPGCRASSGPQSARQLHRALDERLVVGRSSRSSAPGSRRTRGAAAIVRIGLAPDEPGTLEAVEDAGHRPRGQPRQLGQAASASSPGSDPWQIRGSADPSR